MKQSKKHTAKDNMVHPIRATSLGIEGKNFMCEYIFSIKDLQRNIQKKSYVNTYCVNTHSFSKGFLTLVEFLSIDHTQTLGTISFQSLTSTCVYYRRLRRSYTEVLTGTSSNKTENSVTFY